MVIKFVSDGAEFYDQFLIEDMEFLLEDNEFHLCDLCNWISPGCDCKPGSECCSSLQESLPGWKTISELKGKKRHWRFEGMFNPDGHEFSVYDPHSLLMRSACYPDGD